MAIPTVGHTSPEFLETFGSCLEGLKTVFAASDGMPLVVAGSGTFAMELAVSNVIEPGDKAVVIDTGYFSWRMKDILERHGAEVILVSAEVGSVPELVEVEKALKRRCQSTHHHTRRYFYWGTGSGKAVCCIGSPISCARHC